VNVNAYSSSSTAGIANPRLPSYAGFGCSSVWARPDFDGSVAQALLDTAYAGGIRMLDTGPSYGLGTGETRLGHWLQHHGGHDIVISTKAGTNLGDANSIYRSFRPEDLEKSLTGSLKRLGRERVDILYLHGPQPDDLNDEVLRHFEREKQRGRISWSGVNSFDPVMLSRCADFPVDVVMLQYNIVDRSAEKIIPALKKAGKLVLSATALGQAIYQKSTFGLSKYGLWYLLRALKNDPSFPIKGYRLHKEAARRGKTGIALALEFVSSNKEIDGIFFGTSRQEHMAENLLLLKGLQGHP
jgi:D-threo-aldose 1-dehydrogenase